VSASLQCYSLSNVAPLHFIVNLIVYAPYNDTYKFNVIKPGLFTLLVCFVLGYNSLHWGTQ
jgi:hypothetical protein